MQHLLSRARRDAGGVRDDVRSYAAEQLGDPGAVLVVDETGDVKKGTATPGVQRQYTGTAGRIENAQVAVYLGYAAPRGHALIDRALYLPKSWTGNPARCEAAGIPGHAAFATKPQPASLMIERAVSARAPFAWVAADEAYGDNGPLRTWLEQQHIAHVLAVARDHRVPAGPAAPSAPMSSPRGCPGVPGSSYRQVMAPRDTGGTTGPGSPSATPAPDTGAC